MLYLEDITHHRSLEVQMDLRLSRTLKTGSELGLLRDKVCIMVANQCNNQVKTLLTQLLLILVALNFLFLLKYSKRLDKSGQWLFQTSIAHPIRLSATYRTPVRMLPKKLNQSVSK